MKMDRILLKMSGEALAGDKKHGFDEETVRDVSNQVKQIVDKGIQVCVVIGGGNFWRGRTSDNMDRVKADSIGMLATVMNCIYTADSFRSCGIKTHIMTPFVCGNMTELFDKDKAIAYMEQGDVVFFAGGIGHPYFSTDMEKMVAELDDPYAIELMVQSYLEFYDYYNEAKRRAELTGEPIKTDYANWEEFVDKRMQEEGYNFGNVGKGR